MYKLWEALKEARKYRWVELSHSLNNQSPYWAGIPEGSVELGTTCFDWGNEMLDCLIQTFKFPGQFGTHIDFPGHFVKDRELSEHYGVKDLIFPLCVIDVSGKVKENPCYVVTAEDIRAYEARYGEIPEGAFVALRTDWSRRWPDMDALSGLDADGGENFPGWSMEALKYTYEERNAAATYVSAGLGVCILPRTPLHTKYRAVAIPIAYPARSRNICLLYNKSHPMSGSARRFHDFVLSRFPAFHGDQYD